MDHDDTAQVARPISQAKLEEGYRKMADDTDHEVEAEEWAEALIGDAYAKR
jgi:hypothetical protein